MDKSQYIFGIRAVIEAIEAGRDEGYASECVFIGTVLSAVTMPLMIWLLL